MNCVKCGSDKVIVQTVMVPELKEKRHGFVYWLLVGWWWEPIAWLFLTLPKFIITIFKPKRWRTRTVMHTVVACQNCGYSWEILPEKETKKKKKQKGLLITPIVCSIMDNEYRRTLWQVTILINLVTS